jgi:hypothetical protein
MMHLTQAVEQL